jgi:ribosomal-protein-alanine N-acetyltransferase
VNPLEPDFNIRPMKPDDVDQVRSIDQLSFTMPWPATSYYFELQNPHARSWVVEITEGNGQKSLIGMLVLWLIVDEAHIGTIAIHPDYRHHRFGSRLLRHAIKSVQAEGAEIVYLEVRRGNLTAQELYNKFGFELSGVRRGYYSDNQEDALLYTLYDLQEKEFPEKE